MPPLTLPTLTPLARRVPAPLWSLTAVALAAFAVFAFAQKENVADTPPMRLSVALAVFAAVFAARRGVWRFPRLRWLGGAAAFTALATLILAILFPLFANVRSRSGPGKSYVLKQAMIALLQYTQDYDEALPPRMDATAMRRNLAPYLRGMTSPDYMTDPHTNRPFAWRRRLAGLSLNQIPAKIQARILVAYSPTRLFAGETMGRDAVFLDGHIKRYCENDFRAVLQLQSNLLSSEVRPPARVTATKR